jgi:carbon storage regulator
MLVLSRRVGEVVVIDDEIRITVVAIKGDRVRLGITAPDWIRVDREEIHERRVVSADEAIPESAVPANH